MFNFSSNTESPCHRNVNFYMFSIEIVSIYLNMCSLDSHYFDGKSVNILSTELTKHIFILK